MKLLKVVGVLLLAVIGGLVAIVLLADPDGGADRIQTLTRNGKTMHVVTIGSRGAFRISTSPSGSEIDSLGRRYTITHDGTRFLLNGSPLDPGSTDEFSLILRKDGSREIRPGKY
jgi:hypothetical protein